jgi:phosphoribosylformylglycinamidine synthase subunit PurS
MKYIAHINIMPLKELLDPQGKAVNNSLHNLGLQQVQDVRVGKHVTLTIEAANEAMASQLTENACKKLLANAVMEHFEFTITAG